MGKRSDFDREQLDFYRTPRSAVLPLVNHFHARYEFCEPCAGDGALIRHLEEFGFRCVSAFDVNPQAGGIDHHDASFMTEKDLKGAEMIITNPPWDRAPLHQIIERCIELRPSWLLFDADWMHTKQASKYLKYCSDIISIGRVKWIEDSATAGKDNCCWYKFTNEWIAGTTKFWGR